MAFPRPIALRPPAGSPQSVRDDLARTAPALVALSGGVDSAVVASLTAEALGSRAWAVTLSGPAVAEAEVEYAREAARSIGIAHAVIRADPLTDERYRANDANRCAYCRETEAAALRSWGSSHGIRRYLDGVHSDDLGDDRPGIRAMDAAGFEHPLLVAGWGKREIREFARSRGLPNWDRPSNACLASRVRRGQAITADALVRIERAETLVRARGFRRVRVRVDADRARIEVDATDLPRLLEARTADSVRADLRHLGFVDVTIDPVGYRPRPNA
jgi:uncharacterized protein